MPNRTFSYYQRTKEAETKMNLLQTALYLYFKPEAQKEDIFG